MKKILFTLVATLMVLCAQAQELGSVSAAQSREMIAQINAKTSKCKSIVCDFKQTKKIKMLNDRMISHGRMHYTNTGQLRWEYTSPYSYIFIINGNQVTMKSGRQKSEMNIASSRLFQSIARIMMSSVTGQSLTNSKEFKVSMYTYGAHEWVAYLEPRNGDIKKIFKSILVYFDKAKQTVNQVAMIEKNGDTTVIQLNNIKTNSAINASIFSVS